jgi:ABC-type iron transport system FetAB ATPase subunit
MTEEEKLAIDEAYIEWLKEEYKAMIINATKDPTQAKKQFCKGWKLAKMCRDIVKELSI